MTGTYGARPRRRRRSRVAIDAIRDAIYNTLNAYHPMTVRQVFYRLVSAGVIAKTEAEYKRTVVRLLGLMRRAGEIPFGWIADETRWQRKPRTYDSVREALEETARTYRRAVWSDLDMYVEVWLEKEALVGVLFPATEEWDVPLMVTRGYPSLSYLYSAAELIRSIGKPTVLYYFGDWDPSGVDITRAVWDGIAEFSPAANVEVVRVAVTPEQITGMNLPTRSTKKTDSRAGSFAGESVEVDAIPPGELAALVRDCIAEHLDPDVVDSLFTIEQAERETLLAVASQFEEAA